MRTGSENGSDFWRWSNDHDARRIGNHLRAVAGVHTRHTALCVHDYSFNKRNQMIRLVAFPFLCALLAWICTLF